MTIDNKKSAYIKPQEGNEHRIFELWAEIKKRGIPTDGIVMVTDPDQLMLYQAAEEFYRGLKFGEAINKMYKEIRELFPRPKT